MKLVKLKQIDEKRLAQSLQEIKSMMNNSGNFQWYDDYPCVDNFLTDLKNEELYGFLNQDLLLGVVALTTNYEKHYYVEQNSFKFSKKTDKILYIHRLLKFSDIQENGLGKKFLKLIQNEFEQSVEAIQIDTNVKNIPMQKAIKASGFIEVGSFIRIDRKSPNWLCYEYFQQSEEK